MGCSGFFVTHGAEIAPYKAHLSPKASLLEGGGCGDSHKRREFYKANSPTRLSAGAPSGRGPGWDFRNTYSAWRGTTPAK